MKVYSHALEAYSRVALPPAGTPRAAPQAQAPAVGGEAAEVSVSDEARALAARASVGNDSKVSDLKGLVDSGLYAVNAQILAAHLLDHLG